MPSLRESDPILVNMKQNELKSSLKPGLAVLQKIPLSSAQSDSDQDKSNENDEKILSANGLHWCHETQVQMFCS